METAAVKPGLTLPEVSPQHRNPVLAGKDVFPDECHKQPVSSTCTDSVGCNKREIHTGGVHR